MLKDTLEAYPYGTAASLQNLSSNVHLIKFQVSVQTHCFTGLAETCSLSEAFGLTGVVTSGGSNENFESFAWIHPNLTPKAQFEAES